MNAARFLSKMKLVLALGTLVAMLAWSRTSGASKPSAVEFFQQGVAFEEERNEELALRRYSEAVDLDPNLVDAHIRLGKLRAKRGELREAVRVFTEVINRFPLNRDARRERANAFWALDEHAKAEEDLESYVASLNDSADSSLQPLRELASWYRIDNRLSAQLATWRRVLSIATRLNQSALQREARTIVRALQRTIGTADPVFSPTTNATRRAITWIAAN